MRKTRPSSKVVQGVQPAPDLAAALHYPEKRRTYFFQDFMLDSPPKQMITIGRKPGCDIWIDSIYVSKVHAVLERQGETMYLVDHQSTNGVYVGGELIEAPVALTVGMDIQIGHTLLIATDAHGMFPIAADSISEMCRKAVPLYGGARIAGERLDRSHSFIGRQHVPRDQRYTKPRRVKSRRRGRKK